MHSPEVLSVEISCSGISYCSSDAARSVLMVPNVALNSTISDVSNRPVPCCVIHHWTSITKHACPCRHEHSSTQSNGISITVWAVLLFKLELLLLQKAITALLSNLGQVTCVMQVTLDILTEHDDSLQISRNGRQTRRWVKHASCCTQPTAVCTMSL